MTTFQVTSDTGTTATVVTAASATFSIDGALRGPKGADGATPPDATATIKGKIKLANDLGGTADLPTIVATHLAVALPINQGGTGSVTQNFVDLTTAQNIGGIKTFTNEVIVPVPTNASDAATKAYVDSQIVSDDSLAIAYAVAL